MFSLTVSENAVALWWAMAWRSLVWYVILLIPMFLVLLLGTAALEFVIWEVLRNTGLAHYSPAAIIPLDWLIRALFYPVIPLTVVFSRIIRGGGFKGYKVTGSYNGKPLASFKDCFKFAFAFNLETMILYLFPLSVTDMLAKAAEATGYDIGTQFASFSGATVALGLIGYLLLCMYLYWLVLTDLLRRRHFGPCELTVERIHA